MGVGLSQLLACVQSCFRSWHLNSCCRLCCLCLVLVCNLCMQCRGHDGKLGQPSIQPGRLLLLETMSFSTGQAKLTDHEVIHSIRTTCETTPVTLVIRQKDTAANRRNTSCFMVDNDTTAAYRCEDRPCSESERLSMLLVSTCVAL